MQQPNSNNVIPSPLLERPAAAGYLKIGVRTLDDLVKREQVAVIRPSPRRVVFAVSDLDAFLASRRTVGRN